MIKKYSRSFFYLIIFSFLIVTKSYSLNESNGSHIADSLNIDKSKSSWWYGGQAKENYEDKNYTNAILEFSRAIFLDPEVAEFYYYRGNSYAFTGQSANALVDFSKALELNPDYLSALNNLGWEYLKRREISAALRYFFNYLKLLPKDPKILFGMGLNSGYINLLNNLGWEALRKNELTKAIRYFTNYLKLAPKDPDGHLGLALIYYKYGDFENALNYLDQAKSLEPSLYQGYQGIATLERSGCSYNKQDKKLIKGIFLDVNKKENDLQKVATSSIWKLLLGFIYIILSFVATFIFIVRIKRLEVYILYLAILNLCFGLNFLYNNALIQITELPTPNFWIYALPIIATIIPIAFILFIQYFIGWGWKRSILWLLIYSVLQGIVKIIVEYSNPAQDIYGTTNTILGLLAAIVLFLHLFLPNMRKNREVQIITVGLGFYLLSTLYDNLAQKHWLPENISFEEPAYLFFNICLIYVAFRRITNTEKEFVAVKQDLETARNIQNAILPDKNPKGKGFEISAAYLPMALIGGDYYDYQLHDEFHIGVLIADVSGHGISAALIASMLKVAFSSQILNAKHPALVLQQMNLSLTGQLNNEFITAGYFGIDLNNKKLTYSSAGHPPLVVYRREKDEITELKVTGIPIGVYEDTLFKETSIQLIEGDRLIFYTDGILEVFNPSGEIFGRDRFLDKIKQTKNLLAEDAISDILDGLNKWSDKKESESHEDDLTLVVLDVI